MRTVYIDLTRDEAGQRDKINVGYTGEHNATELVVAVPQAMAEAFRSGNLGIMDYYRMQNIQADTTMREQIAGGAPSTKKK